MKREKSVNDNVLKYKEEKETADILKEKEFKKRRDSKKAKKQMILQDRRVRCYRSLYVPTIICIGGGCVIVLMSTVQNLGEGTFIYTYRRIFHYVGPITLAFGIILMLVSVGLTDNRTKTVKSKILREFSAKSKTISKRSSYTSLSHSLTCHSIEDRCEEDFKESNTLVPPQKRHQKRIFSRQSSSNSVVSFSDEVSYCSSADIFSQSHRSKEGDKSTSLRTSKSLDIHGQPKKNNIVTKHSSLDAKSNNSPVCIDSHVGIRIVIQRPSDADTEESNEIDLKCSRNGHGPKRNGMRRNPMIRQKAISEDDDVFDTEADV